MFGDYVVVNSINFVIYFGEYFVVNNKWVDCNEGFEISNLIVIDSNN